MKLFLTRSQALKVKKLSTDFRKKQSEFLRDIVERFLTAMEKKSA